MIVHAAERPRAIAWAEIAGLIGAALGLGRELAIWDQRVKLDGVPLAFAFTLGTPIVIAFLVLAVTRGRRITALIILLLLTLLAWLTTVKLGLTDGSVGFTMGAGSLIAGTLSLLLMFLPTSTRFVRGRPSV